MTSPNANASAGSVADKLDGIGDPNRRAAMFYKAHMFGRSRDYAFPEGANVSGSLLDHGTSLAKLLTRTQELADGNEYDLWDAVMTITKIIVAQNPHINDDEVNSVNYKKQA